MRPATTLALVSLLFLAGCGTSRQSVPVAAVNAPIPEGQARVVIARKGNLLVAQGVRMDVKRDGQLVGSIAPDGFLAWDQPPGKVSLDVEGNALPLTLEPGKAICVEFTVGASGGGVHLMVIDSGNYGRLISSYSAPGK
jgi:hypothetical protein